MSVALISPPQAIKTSFDTVEKKPKTSSIPSLVEDLRAGASSELARIYENFRQLNALDYELYEFVKVRCHQVAVVGLLALAVLKDRCSYLHLTALYDTPAGTHQIPFVAG